MARTFDWVDIFSHLKMHIKADMCSKILSIVSDHTVGFCGRGKAKTAISVAKMIVFQLESFASFYVAGCRTSNLLWLIGMYIRVIFHINKISTPPDAKKVQASEVICPKPPLLTINCAFSG